MFGYFIITELTGAKDKAGYHTMAKVKNKMNENILGTLYLLPHLRQAQCNIGVDSVVVGTLDEVTGLGFAFVGIDDADFQYFYNANIDIKKTLNVEKAVTMHDKLDVTKDISTSTGNITASTGNITATVGDCVATTVSLKTHVHPAALTVTGSVTPAGVVEGGATGTTATPTP